MAGPLTPEMQERFLELFDAWQEGRPTGQAQTFMVSRLNDRYGARLIHPGLSPERGTEEGRRQWNLPTHELHHLNELGLIRLEIDNGRGRFWLTPDGEALAHRLRSGAFKPGAGALDWQADVLPVLAAVNAAYVKQPGSMGVQQAAINAELGRLPADTATDLVLFHLVRAGYVEATLDSDQAVGPMMSLLTEKGLQQVANWPSGAPEDVLVRLLAALEERIRETDDPEERTKLESVRDSIKGMGRDVMTQVLSKVLSGEVSGVIT
jgi:hypothetical protein